MTKRTPLWTKFNWLVLPQILLFLFLSLYLVVGIYVFQYLDEELSAKSFNEMLLFEVSTLATIGYGDVHPKTMAARAFCMAFSILGIPLFLLMVANIGKHLTKAFWHIYSRFVGKTQLGALRGDMKMPLVVSVSLFSIIIAIGTETMAHNGDGSFIDDLYFSFISFATVGYGDKVPIVNTMTRLIFGLIYIIAGVVAISAIFTTFNDYLRKLHYIGRRFRGSRDVQVWMGGRSMTVSKLLSIVGEEFDASPREIREVLRDLDCLLLSVAEHQEKERERLRLSETSQLLPPIAKDIEDFDDV